MTKARKPIKSHKGGRTLQSNIRRNPVIQGLLNELGTRGLSQADVLEYGTIQKCKELGISIPSEVNHAG